MNKTLDLLTPSGNLPVEEDFEVFTTLPDLKETFGDVDGVGMALLAIAESVRQTTIVTNLETAVTLMAFSLERLFELGWRIGVVDVEQDTTGDDGDS